MSDGAVERGELLVPGGSPEAEEPEQGEEREFVSEPAKVMRVSEGSSAMAASTAWPTAAGSLTSGSCAPGRPIQPSSHTRIVPLSPISASNMPTMPPAQRCRRARSCIRTRRASSG